MIRTRATSSGVAIACAVEAAIAPPIAASTGEELDGVHRRRVGVVTAVAIVEATEPLVTP
eukprot:scaffold77844_cov60-Phaeocystis_antarctica.AAC.1